VVEVILPLRWLDQGAKTAVELGVRAEVGVVFQDLGLVWSSQLEAHGQAVGQHHG